MSYRPLLGPLLACLASPACADVTPAEVFSEIETYYASTGAQISVGERAEDGDDLILRDVLVVLDTPEGETRFELPEMRLEADGDGVLMTLSETMSAVIPTKVETVVSSVKVDIAQKGLEAEITGAVGALEIAYEMAEFSAEVPGVDIDGKPMPLKLRVALNDTAGTQSLARGPLTKVTGAFTTDALSFTLSAADSAATGTMTMEGLVRDLDWTMSGTTPEGVNTADLPAALKAGFASDGTVKTGSMTLKSETTSETGAMQMAFGAQEGDLAFSLSAQGLDYSVGQTGITFDATSAQLPFPVSGKIAVARSGMKLPMGGSDAPTPIGLALTLENLELNEELWALFDPTKQLPRDPATLVLDLEGMGTFNPESAEAGQMPGAIESAALKALRLKLMGAEVTGTGAATFDNSAEVPVPVGAVDLKLTGINSLLDKLVAAGIVPAEQLMGVRMMLGLFAVPEGNDGYVSKIEMREDGGLYANGQRLQ